MRSLPVGTIVRLRQCADILGVIVPREYAPRTPTEYFLRFLEPPNVYCCAGHKVNGGWYFSRTMDYGMRVVSEDEITDEQMTLAMRCVLDSKFIPFRGEDE